MEALAHLLAFALGILVPYGLFRWDEGRLSAEQKARAWNDASRWSAIVAFPFVCVLVHFYRTRGGFIGLALGFGWMVATFIATSILLWPLEWLTSS